MSDHAVEERQSPAIMAKGLRTARESRRLSQRELAARVNGYTTDYLIAPFTAKGKAALKPGKNTIAIHCKQTGGGQYIDTGIVDLIPAQP